jgi:hypothetical protein
MIGALEAATTLARSATARAPSLDSPWVTAVFALVVAVLTWDPQPIIPAPGLDPSWTLGLNLAAASGLDHGTEVIFTYGPLGFLELPQVAEGGLAGLSAVYLLATRALLAASLLAAARRSLPWAAAALLAICVVAIAPRATGSVPLALATVWCLVALQWPDSPWARRLLVFGGGALAAVEVLVKLNSGLTILLLVVIATAAMPGRRVRNLATLLGVFAAVFAVLWFAAGQGVGNLDDYLRSSALVVSGYSEAMQVEAPVVAWDWAAALLAGAATLAATAYAGAGLSGAQRIAMVAVVAVVVFSLWKFGFVRHDGGHVGAFFEGLFVVWAALAWRGRTRLVPFAALAALAVVYFAAAGRAADFTIRPASGVEQLEQLLVSSEDERDAARARMQLAYGVDPRIIERIGDAPVDIRPWEIGLAWAYGLDWRPLPVLQDYLAYDPELDEVNADWLRSQRAPQFILRHLGYADSSVVGIDGRFTSFDSPQATVEILCHYRPDITTDTHQLLVRTAADRCGEPTPLGEVRASFGESIEVPRPGPGEAVIARIEGAGAEGAERLRAFAYRAALRRIRLGEARANFPPRNAGGGLLVAAGPGADFPPPFALAPDVETIAIESEGGFATSGGPLEISFEALPVGRP